MFGVYIHVPFCSSRCGYCDFNTYTPGELGTSASPETYLDALEQELELAEFKRPADTIFIGGGTPSLLGAQGLRRILTAIRNTFGINPGAEITTESNPESTSPEFFAELRDAGFTRISLGMQSASAHVLQVLERRHTPGRAFAAVAEARAAGFWRRALRHPGFVVGSLLVLALVLMAGVSAFWTPYGPEDLDMEAMLESSSAAHWLGTDAFGRDVASLLLLGAQASLLAGVIAVGIGLGAGLLLGLLAAARPGRVQGLIMRTADFMLAFPAILTAIMLTAVFGAGLGNAIVAVGIYNIPSFVRITRAAAAGVWSREYAMAARACGLGPWQITWRHVLPNILPLLLVQATVRFAVAILAEAALSFLGFGVQPPQPSWGRMLADAQSVLFEAPLQALWPGLAIMLAVLGLNLLGDGLRDLLDPKLRRR